MHQLILITAMSATTGLFGGGKHCGKPQHSRKAMTASSCYSASPCRATYGSPTTMHPTAMSAPAYAASPQAAPISSVPTAPAVPAPSMAPPAPPAPTPTPSSPPVSGS